YVAAFFLFLFSHATPTTVIYTLSLHDALPIFGPVGQPAGVVDHGGLPVLGAGAGPLAEVVVLQAGGAGGHGVSCGSRGAHLRGRSEEHTSELQSRENLVCRLLLEKKKQYNNNV